MTPDPPEPHTLSGSADVGERLDSTFGVEPDTHATTVIDRVLEAVAALLLATITLVLFANAGMRFLFDSPWGGTEELVTGLMLWLTMLGFAIGVRRRESIEVRAFVDRLPVRIAVWLKLATDLLMALILLHLAWFAYQYVVEFGGDLTPYLRLPRAFFTAALPVGAFAAAVIVALQLPNVRAAVLRQREEYES
ncbi:TRAP transporter small permease [Mycolicibacterium baixiangningiae]|uniref:TRAP transporter small permease n=1 Tax=Mycolicibacterium baixiangningiae TaxID=2761578 RepID=UPI0018CFF912|nr:TRAP transporter small permease [Mycolicibacterium baixiangningiae]